MKGRSSVVLSWPLSCFSEYFPGDFHPGPRRRHRILRLSIVALSDLVIAPQNKVDHTYHI